ncbi:hypothetical protein [Streptomyces sp. NPDC008092]|uniref:hypothetical protein n=1 Tax=Streptomyces sp. NPDC008092 TaxID=3364808 RepID=UPI0036E30F2A
MQGAHGHDGPDSRRTRRTRRGIRLGASFAGVTAMVLFAGACSDGGSGSDTGAGGGASATTQGKSTLAYAQCMRKNGVANFPDPNAQGLIDINGNNVDMQSAQAQAADKKCKSLLPAGGGGSASQGVRDASLAYAKCMRKNGVPKFPDPNADGGLDINAETLGVDPNGEIYAKADKICQPILEKAAGGNKKEVQSGAPGQ